MKRPDSDRRPVSCNCEHDSQPRPQIGLVAGWGRYPIVIAEALIDSGHDVVCCGIRGHADPVLANICTRFRLFGMARMGSQLRYLRRHGVTQATMAGKIFKTLLFRRFQFLHHIPDWTTVRHFYPVVVSKTRDRRDDTLLTTVTQLYAAGGIQFRPATDFAPELLVKEGPLTRCQPTRSQLLDIKFGWQMAKHMGHLDVGQSVAVKGQAVLAVEAIEGTDECIRRAGSLCSAGGFVVVKVAKPRQDMRFDVPTVGISTIETMQQAGATVLAIEAGKTIVLDQDEFIRRANQARIRVIALPSEAIREIAA